MDHSPLISAEELAARPVDDRLVIFDCRFVLPRPEQGLAQYREGHIPGAVYADLDRHLADLTVPRAGRHPLPDRDVFRRWLESCGVSDHTELVCYDDAGGAIAARLWWMAGWIGLDNARVLDGGLSAWTAAGFPLETDVPRPEPGRITAVAAAAGTCDLDTIETIAAGTGDLVLLDARDPDRYLGRKEPLDPVAGHVPGALNAPFSDNLDEQRRFLPADALRERFTALGGERDPAQFVHMCGSGVTACHNLLAMAVAGLPGARLFPGSWSQWVDDPSRPVATEKSD